MGSTRILDEVSINSQHQLLVTSIILAAKQNAMQHCVNVGLCEVLVARVLRIPKVGSSFGRLLVQVWIVPARATKMNDNECHARPMQDQISCA